MDHKIKLIALAAIFAFAGLGVRPELAFSETAGNNVPDFAPGRIIVKVEEEAQTGSLAVINRANDARVEERLESDLSVVDLPNDLSVGEAVARYESSPNVEYAEPDYLVNAQNLPSPNDTYYPRLWGLENTGHVYRTEDSGKTHSGTPDADIDAPEAWSVTTGNPNTIVAVIDSGVDINHPDLDGNIWTNPDEIANNGKDDDDNGYVDDVHGWDFLNDDASVFDSATNDRHGTHVAGTIAAERNNGAAVAGVAPRAKVMPLKFIGPQTGYVSDAVAALDYAVAEGVGISNNSWGCACPSQALSDAISRADAAGHLFVVAAENGGADGIGDDNDRNPVYPASYGHPNIISVAASNDDDRLTAFSNYGATSVDLAAPGMNILSTLPDNHVGFFQGTSMATPHVAGVAALVKSKFPELDDAGIKALILGSVDRKTNLVGKVSSGGRLNAARALGVMPNTSPKILNPSPGSGSKLRDRTPTMKVTVRDAQTNLAKSDIKLYFHGQRIYGFSYDRADNRLTYTTRKLSFTRHGVRVVVRDEKGLDETRAWKFRVVR